MTTHVDQQRKIAEKFIEPFRKNEKVEGIAFLGSIARNFGDVNSDIDIAIFSNEKLEGIRLGEQWINGWDIEVFNIVMDKGSDEWSEAQREAYAEAVLVYDRNGKVQHFLQRALEYSAEYRLEKLVQIFFELGWHGWSYTAAKGKEWRGYVWSLPSDLWIKRKRLDNAFYILKQSADMLIDLVYAINGRWLPDIKWKWIKSSNLDWLPDRWEENLKFIMMTEDTNEENWYKKASVMQQMIDTCYERVLSELPDDMYDYLINEIGEYN